MEILSKRTAQYFAQLPGHCSEVTFHTKYPSAAPSCSHPASSLSQAQPDVHGKPDTHHWKPQAVRLVRTSLLPPTNTSVLDKDPFHDTTAEIRSTKWVQEEAQVHSASTRISPAQPRSPRGRPRPPVAGASAVPGSAAQPGFPNWLGVARFTELRREPPGPPPLPSPARQSGEAGRMPRSFTHKMILCPIVLAVVQLSGGD